jgi:hypothetical protein
VNEAMHWLFTDEATAHGGLGEYEMRKKGLVPTGLDKSVCFVIPHNRLHNTDPKKQELTC